MIKGNTTTFFAGLVSLSLTGCLKKELPVPRHESGNVVMATVDMDATYKYQVYYNLETNTTVGRNLKTAWDLGFETSAEGCHVVLNGAKSMFALNTGKADFAAVSAADTAGYEERKRWDSYHGSMDSTAIGDWRVATPVYIVDCGYDEMGRHQGFTKFQALSVDKDKYQVRFASLNGAGDTIIKIAKDSLCNLAFLSFASRSPVMVEPPKNTWDIAFTQYTFVFYDMAPPMPYLVTGVVLNRNTTAAYMDTVLQFQDVNLQAVAAEKFTDDISAIGYDWKVYNGTSYTVDAKKKYIIRDSKGYVYKLHFTGFYNTAGQKGNPQWEYQKL